MICKKCKGEMVYQPSQVQWYCAKDHHYQKPVPLLRGVDFSREGSDKEKTNA